MIHAKVHKYTQLTHCCVNDDVIHAKVHKYTQLTHSHSHTQAPPSMPYSVDNPSFTVKPAERVLAKKATTIAIAFKPSDPSKPRTGKLTVTCPLQTSVSWVYYLQA